MHPNINENQRRWIEALESGQYKQRQSYLRDWHDNFCCLGVACEVIGMKAEISENDFAQYDGQISVAPKKVVEEMELYNNYGEGPEYSLTDLNDMGYDFHYIAQRLKTGEYFRNCQVTP